MSETAKNIFPQKLVLNLAPDGVSQKNPQSNTKFNRVGCFPYRWHLSIAINSKIDRCPKIHKCSFGVRTQGYGGAGGDGGAGGAGGTGRTSRNSHQSKKIFKSAKNYKS